MRVCVSLLLYLGCQAVWSFRTLAHNPITTPLSAELRIQIQGTKNAFTTVRDGDVVSYTLTKPVDGRSIRLGVLSSDGLLLPLCAKDAAATEFQVDSTAEPLSVERLKGEGRLGRMFSADRREGVYTIEEYISSDIYIPVVEQASSSSASSVSITGEPSLLESEVALLQKELEVAQLEYRLLKLRHDALVRQQHESQPSEPADPADKISVVLAKDAPLPIGPYSQAVKLGKDLVFVSGCIGIDPSIGKLVDGGIEAQTRQSLANLAAILRTSGSHTGAIMKATIYVTDLGQYATVNKLYGEFLKDNKVLPARTTVQVSALPLGALVEIDAFAAI